MQSISGCFLERVWSPRGVLTLLLLLLVQVGFLLDPIQSSAWAQDCNCTSPSTPQQDGGAAVSSTSLARLSTYTAVIFAFIGGAAAIIGLTLTFYQLITRSGCPLKSTENKAAMQSVAETWLFDGLPSQQKPQLESFLDRIFRRVDRSRVLVNPRLLFGFLKRKSVAGIVLEEPFVEGSSHRVDIHLVNLHKYNWRGHRIHSDVAMTAIESHPSAMAAAKGDLRDYNRIVLSAQSLPVYRQSAPQLYPYMELFVSQGSHEWLSYLSHDSTRFFVRFGHKNMGIVVYAMRQAVEDLHSALGHQEASPSLPAMPPPQSQQAWFPSQHLLWRTPQSLYQGMHFVPRSADSYDPSFEL